MKCYIVAKLIPNSQGHHVSGHDLTVFTSYNRAKEHAIACSESNPTGVYHLFEAVSTYSAEVTKPKIIESML